MDVLIYIFMSLILLSPLLLSSTEVYAHSGRTDSYGGHNKYANGTYHCHSGLCLQEAKNKTYNDCYPRGEEDGETGEKNMDFIYSAAKNIDSDQRRYLVPACEQGYQDGFMSTVSFWNLHKKKIYGLGTVFVVPLLIYRKSIFNNAKINDVILKVILSSIVICWIAIIVGFEYYILMDFTTLDDILIIVILFGTLMTLVLVIILWIDYKRNNKTKHESKKIR